MHGLDLQSVSALDLIFDVALKYAGSGSPSVAEVWLSDGNQNGYGLKMIRSLNSGADATNVVQIMRYSGGAVPFGNLRGDINGTILGGPFAYSDISTDAFESLSLRIEQNAAGSGLEVMLWAGETFLFKTNDETGVVDLTNLTHVAFAADRDNGSGGTADLDMISVARFSAAPSVATNNTPVSWLQDYGYTNNYDAAAMDDLDGDGFANWQEYHADTNPTNSASVLRIDISGSDVQFDSSSNIAYEVEVRDDLILGGWNFLTNFNGTGSTFVLTATNGVSSRFYRLKASRQ